MSNSRKRERSDVLTVVLHWTMVITLVASFVTGLRISADNPDEGWATLFTVLLPQGDVFRWHVYAGFGLGIVSIAYVIFLIAAGVRSRIALKSRQVSAAAKGNKSMLLRTVNVALYWCGFALLLIAFGTGILHYMMPPFVPQELVLTVHRTTAWLFTLYLVLHVAAQLAHGGIARLLKILTPRLRYGAAALIAATAAGLSGFTVYAVERSTLPTLTVAAIPPVDSPTSPELTAVWHALEPVKVHTVRGANHVDGEVTVEIKAAHDGEYLYTEYRWFDQTRSQKHLPLLKTKDGWKVQQAEYHIQDEDLYYEDKFAVMWGDTPRNAGAGTSHMGSKPLANKPGPAGGRGLHYTTDGEIVDVWHWKSVRTGSMETQQIDDNYFGPPMDVDPEKSRYTGGYTQDPDDGGGYTMNWEKFDTDVVTPKYLPKDASLLARLGDVELNPHVSDSGEFWMNIEETIPYSESEDTYPVGTIIPSVILKGPRLGDRGDVYAASEWKDNYWTMHVRRKLDTGSQYDVPFIPGEPLYMWVAAFDHAQTRHSYHLRPVKVEFKTLPDLQAS